MLVRVILFLFLVLVFKSLDQCTACDVDQTRQGCRIKNMTCSCGSGCPSEYRYNTIEECRRALKGKKRDVCNPNPCLHNGSCTQISQHQGYKCRCEGTGYYGQQCDTACPTAAVISGAYPYECIVI